MRNVFLLAFIVGCVGCFRAARAEVYEVPLPEVIGDYVPHPPFLGMPPATRREFSFDLGFPLAQVHGVRFRVEGTMFGQMASGLNAGPWNLRFYLNMREGSSWAEVEGPPAGRLTYPEPEPFAGERPLARSDWSLIEDGSAKGHVLLSRGLHYPETHLAGGSGTITGAWLIIDATAVPEPGALTAAVVAGVAMLRRRRGVGGRVRVGSEA